MAKKHKVSPTKGMNKAEKFVFQLLMNDPNLLEWQLRQAVATKLGLPLDGFEYADVPMPKLPPEYDTAIKVAVRVRFELTRPTEAKKQAEYERQALKNAKVRAEYAKIGL